MSQSAAIAAVPYDPIYEKPDPQEPNDLKEGLKTLANIRETTFKDTGHAMRSVHTKSHGLLKAEMKVYDNLPPQLAQGIFSTPSTYPTVLRLSTTPGDILPDSVSTPRGCAIKVIGVTGERLAGSDNDITQNFVMVNGGSTFMANNIKGFTSSLKAFAAGTDKAVSAKEAISAVMQGAEKVIEGLGGKSGTIRGLGGEPATSILGETFYSQVPILYGKYMAKLSLVPVSGSLTALTGKPLTAPGDNPIRDEVNEFFQREEAVWELRVQLCTDIDEMPIEEAAVEWSEELSPYIGVARITAKRQTAWSPERSKVVDDKMAFSPWSGVAAHRPLGSIMRARRDAYKQSADFRAQKNGNDIMTEPKSIDVIPE